MKTIHRYVGSIHESDAIFFKQLVVAALFLKKLVVAALLTKKQNVVAAQYFIFYISYHDISHTNIV